MRFFKAGDEKNLARAIVDAYEDREFSSRLSVRALEFARENSWSKKSSDYLEIVERLMHDHR